MTETIRVYLKPILGVGGILGYHETLVYTNSSGQSFYASAAPTNANDGSLAYLFGTLENMSSAESDVSTNTPSWFGTITGSANVAFDPNSASSAQGITEDANGVAYTSFEVASGSDLSGQWNDITAAENLMFSEHLTYAPTTQNSNSVAVNALNAAGLVMPSGVAAYNTPGGETPLPILASWPGTTSVSSTTDGAGNTITTYTVADAADDTAGTVIVDSTVSGNLMNVSINDITPGYNGNYYIVQSGDVGGTDADTWNNVASQASTYDDFSVTGSELGRINSALGVSPTAGSMVFIPNASASVGTTPTDLSELPSSQAYVYDSANGTAYSIGAELGDDGQSGTLYILDNSGNPTVFGPNTWQDVADSSDDSGTVVDLKDGGGDNTGTLTIDKSAGTITLEGTSGSPSTETFTSSTGPVFVIGNADGSDTVGQLGGAAWRVNTDGTLSSVANPFPDGGATSMGSWTSFVSSLFNRSMVDPIVLDLSGEGGGTATGVQLTSLTDSSAYFDLHGTGFAVNTGWVSATTGILVDTTDPTSISNLFGSSSTDGFAALEAADTNHDGVINSSDSDWSSLYVWEDTNGNGTADSGEVHSLSSLGITSISLETTPVNETVNGNYISEVAIFHYSGGGTGQVAEAFFDNSEMDSTYAGSYTLNPDVLTLPNLRGYGTVPDLYIAMSQDSTLLGMVQDLASDSISDAATFDAQVQSIIYEWTGVSSVDPTSRGDYVNAQSLEALEAMAGESWSVGTNTNPPNSDAAVNLENAWNDLFTAVKERLLAQGPLAQYLSGVSYDYDTDSLTGTTDFSSLLTAIGSNVPSDATAAAQYLGGMGQFIDQLATDLGVSASTYDTTLQGYFTSAGLPLSLTAVDNLHYLLPSYDGSDVTFSTDSAGAIANGIDGLTNILAGGGDLTQDVITNIQTLQMDSVTLTGSEFDGFSYFTPLSTLGSMTITAAGTYDISSDSSGTISMYDSNNGNVTLIGNGAGSETLDASGTGNNTLTAGNGNLDALTAGTGNNTLTAGDGNYDTLTAGNGNNTLTAGNGSYDTLSAGSGTNTLTVGSGTGDTLYAESGTATLVGGSGGDIFYSGTGVDTLEGGTGNDTFIVSSTVASGSSITGGGGSDTLEVSSKNISPLSISGVQTLEINGSVTLSATELGDFSSITTLSGGVGQLYAATAGTYNLSSTSTAEVNMYAQSNGGTTLVGNNASNELLEASASGNDTLTAGNGNNDTLSAGSGTSTLTAGSGTGDTLYAASGTSTLIGGSGGDIFYSGTGVDTMEGGTGNDTFSVSSVMASGSSITGGGGTDTLNVTNEDISSLSISDIHTLEITGAVHLTAAQFGGFGAITTPSGASGMLYATTAGTYDLVGMTTAQISMQAKSNSGTTLIGNNANSESLTGSTSGNDTLTGGSGNSDTLSGGGGNDTLTVGNGNSDTVYAGGNGTDTITLGNGSGDMAYAGNGSDTFIAGTGNDSFASGTSGTDIYELGSSFGSDTIYNNYYGGKSTAGGEVSFLSSTTDENLWFQRSGNNLVVDLLGTSDKVTISNWYSGAGDQVASFTADGMTLDTSIASLVSAMASYASANPSFNPTTATSMPTDTTLQSAIASAWHT